MNLGTVIFRLPVGIARSLTDFLFNPALGAHAQRISAWVPAPMDETQPAAAKSLANLLGQAEPVLEPDQPLHQIALLPQPWLADLARRVAVDTLEWALRQVVWRKDLEQLDPFISQEDWQRVYAAAASGGDPERRIQGVTGLIHDLQCVGWNFLERASDTLPRAVGRRLLLKCEPVALPSVALAPADDDAAATRVVNSYKAWVESAVPGWSQSLAEVPSLIRG